MGWITGWIIITLIVGWLIFDYRRGERWSKVIEEHLTDLDASAADIDAALTIVSLRQDLARCGRALMAHPKGHPQDLIDDALGWVADMNVATAFEQHNPATGKPFCLDCARGKRERVRGREWQCELHRRPATTTMTTHH